MIAAETAQADLETRARAAAAQVVADPDSWGAQVEFERAALELCKARDLHYSATCERLLNGWPL